MDYYNQGYSFITKTVVIGDKIFSICIIKWWNYFISLVELIFLIVGMYLLHCTRCAPMEFYERKLIAIVIYMEGITSISANIIKHFYSLYTDVIIVTEFVRCHLTITLMIVLFFFSKLYLIFKFNYGDREGSINSDGLNLCSDASKDLINLKSSGGEPDSLIMEMKQDDIRTELKRLYMQLHTQKLLTVKLDNPHVNAKRKPNKKNKQVSQVKTTLRDSESNEKSPENSLASNELNCQLNNH